MSTPPLNETPLPNESAKVDGKPTREEIITFYREQIEIRKLQAELAQLNAEISMARAEEIKAMAFVAQMTQPPQEKDGDTKTRNLKKEN